MGVHVDLLELGRRAVQLLPLRHLPVQPPSGHIPLEPIFSGRHVRCLPVCVLGMGYDEQPKEPIPAARTRHGGITQDISATAMADAEQSKDHYRPGRYQDSH